MKRNLAIAGAFVFASVGAFVGGRFSAPLKVETREVEKVVYKERVVEKRVEVATAAKVVTQVVYRDRVTKPDGTVTEHTEEHTGTEEHAHTEVTSAREVIKEVFRDREVIKITTLRPDWRVGAQIGAQIGNKPVLPVYGPLVVGAEIDRRIIGGLSVGIWANTGGAGGVAVSFEF